MNELVNMISEKVVYKEKPAVYLSGGMDSAIILYHLSSKSQEQIYTYYAKFGMGGDMCEEAREVADYYGAYHKEVEVTDFVETLKEVMKFFDSPRYNVWPYWLAVEARKDGRRNMYVGEGSDERFGGYDDRDYLHAWASWLTYIEPTYVTIHKHLRVGLEMPFADLNWRDTLPYYFPTKKKILRDAYKGLIPKAFIERDSRPPAFINYKSLWDRDIKEHFPDYNPETIQEIRNILQLLATQAWIKARFYTKGSHH